MEKEGANREGSAAKGLLKLRQRGEESGGVLPIFLLIFLHLRGLGLGRDGLGVGGRGGIGLVGGRRDDLGLGRGVQQALDARLDVSDDGLDQFLRKGERSEQGGEEGRKGPDRRRSRGRLGLGLGLGLGLFFALGILGKGKRGMEERAGADLVGLGLDGLLVQLVRTGEQRLEVRWRDGTEEVLDLLAGLSVTFNGEGDAELFLEGLEVGTRLHDVSHVDKET